MIAALFVGEDGPYVGIPGVDVWEPKANDS